MLDISDLERILRETINTIRKSQEQMFSIAENAREECQRVKKDFEEVQHKTAATIKKVDTFEEKDKIARRRLVEVSKNFDKFGEEDIKEAYENAKNIQVELALLREREKQLREKRTELELRYKNLKIMVKKAESLISQVGIAMDFLGSNLESIWGEMEKAQVREKTVFAIIKAQEEERLRIARDIHDGPAQSLANMVMQAEYCQKLLDLRPHEVSWELETLKNIARSNLESIRKIIFSLRPMDLDDLGLVPAVKRFLNEFNKGNNLAVEFRFYGREQRYKSVVEVAVFRIIQEAVNNAVKHAKASTLEIVLETQASRIAAIIRDDGVGFGCEDEAKENSFGIKGMRERATLLNGEVKINSIPGKGTEVIVKIPVQEEELYGVS